MIEAATGVRRETISSYLAAAGIPVRRRGGRVADWPPSNPATAASACEPYRELIVDGLRRCRNAMGIWQDLVDGHGFTGRYASVRRLVCTLRGTATPEPSGIITTPPGEDYGKHRVMVCTTRNDCGRTARCGRPCGRPVSIIATVLRATRSGPSRVDVV